MNSHRCGYEPDLLVAVPLPEPPGYVTAVPPWYTAASPAALPLALWGQHPLLGIPQCPSHRWYSLTGLGAPRGSGANKEGLWKGRHTGFCEQHIQAGLECSHQPAAEGGLPRE